MFKKVLLCCKMRTMSRAKTEDEMWVWSLCWGIKRKMVDVFIIHHRDPYRIQTCNLLIRSQTLYSVELMGRLFLVCDCKVTTFF